AAMAPARDYLAVLEQRARYRTEPLPLREPPATAPAVSFPAAPHVASKRHREGWIDSDQVPDEGVSTLWRRIPLGEDAELVISERAYTRHRERIEWLIRWARKVFA
ncbi:MAG: hypothetical protein KC442_13110, partial [Thermomicrobiales bacterium]|nr:hypothetical protein [Thermomicrobiales bacterium]